MNLIHSIPINSFITDKISVGSEENTSYLWNNLIIEEQIQASWVDRLYKDSVFHDFWSVLSSPVT